MRHTSGRMAGCCEGASFDVSDTVRLAWFEEVVELAAIGVKRLTFVEYFAENSLDNRDLVTNRGFAAELFADIRRSGQMVGMDMGVDDPFAGQPILAHKIDESVR